MPGLLLGQLTDSSLSEIDISTTNSADARIDNLEPLNIEAFAQNTAVSSCA